MQNSELINKINLEYYNLIISNIKNDEIYKIEFPAFKIWPKVFDGSSIILKTRFGDLTPIQYKAITLLHEIYKFWQKNIKEYCTAVENLNTNKSYQTTFNRNATLFFDTIVLRHNIYSHAKMCFDYNVIHPTQTTSETIRLIRDIVPIFPYLTTNHSIPLIAFDVWDDFKSKRTTNIFGHKLELDTWGRSRINVEKIIKSIAKDKYKEFSFSDFYELSRFKGPIDLSKIINTNALICFLEGRKFAKEHLIASDWNAFMEKSTTIINADVFGFLIESLASCVTDLDFQDDGCTIYKADPIIEFYELYKLRISIEASRTLEAIGLSQDYGVAQSISLPAFDWIKNMSNDDIIHFREIDGAHYLRKIFNEQKQQIKNASIDDFIRISESAKEKIVEAIKEENNRIKFEKEKIKKDLLKTSLSLGFTVTLGIVSIAAPPLLVLTIPSAVFAALIGSSSAKDLINMYLNGKRDDRLIKERPIGILAKYIEQ